MGYGPGDLDILSRAFHDALDSLASDVRGREATKAALMAGIIGAARAGERDEDKLKASALDAIDAINVHDEASMEAVMQTAPL